MVDRTVLVRLKANVSDFVAGVGLARAAVRGFTSDIDTTNDRVAWLSQSILGLGPALVPLGAAAVPIFAGIATQAVLATAGVGAMAMAFNGVGDAMKAVNDYQLDPTVANFEKMRLAMDELGPAGRDFVMFLDTIEPQLRRLQDISEAGILPGATEGLEALLGRRDEIEGLFTDVSEAVGDLMSQAGQGIEGDSFQAFFEFLDRNAKPILTELGETVGNFTVGFANMLVAFEPLTQQFSTGLLNMSESFADFWSGAPTDAGFQGFLTYVQESIPKALDFLSSLADAIAAIVVAAAPVGDIMLPVLSNLLDVIAGLAQTPLGPLFLTAAAAVSIYGRAAAIASVTTGGLLGKMGGLAKANLGFVATTQKAVPSMRDFGQWATFMGQSAENASKKTLAARSAVHAFGRTLVPVAGTLATVGIVATGAADGLGIQNAAMLALTGAMIGGPGGAVAGGLVGATLDLQAANQRASQSARQIAADMKAAGGDFGAYEQAVTDAQDRLKSFDDDIDADSIGEALINTFDPDYIRAWRDIANGVPTQGDKMAASFEAAAIKADDFKLAAGLLAEQFGVLEAGERMSSLTTEELTNAVALAAPAMHGLGITVDDLIAAVRDGSIMQLIADLEGWQTNADSTAGKTEDLVMATVGLDDAIRSTEQSATALANALDALFGPKLDLSAALDAWSLGLKDLNKDLAEHNRTLVGNSRAALRNREVMRDRVTSMIDVLKAEADAGAGAGKLTRTLRDQRNALIEAGEAAGLSKREMRDYLRELGLTPGLVSTLIEAKTEGAEAALARFKSKWDGLRSKQLTLSVVTQRFNLNEQLAEGGIHPGDVANHHQPQIAPPGTNRVWAEPETQGEAYIPLANDYRRPRARSILELTAQMLGGNVQWYAEGGVTTSNDIYTRRRNDVSGVQELNRAARSTSNGLKNLERQLAKAEKAVAREERQREAIINKMSSIAGAVTSGLRSDIFAAADTAGWSPWAQQMFPTASSANGILDADTAEGQETIRLIRTLKNKGVREEALGELLGKNDIGLLREYAAMSETELAVYVKKFTQRERVLAQAGLVAGQAAFGHQEAQAVEELREARKELRDIKRAIEHADDRNVKGHQNTAHGWARGMNGAATDGRRKARRRTNG